MLLHAENVLQNIMRKRCAGELKLAGLGIKACIKSGVQMHRYDGQTFVQYGSGVIRDFGRDRLLACTVLFLTGRGRDFP